MFFINNLLETRASPLIGDSKPAETKNPSHIDSGKKLDRDVTSRSSK
jgi:hypothetical protein